MGTDKAGLWADEDFDFDDALNAEVWRESPMRGARLAAANARGSAGGWQDRWASPPLPWVPDLVGRRWRERGGVVVIGSAYAPFVGGNAARRAAMPLSSYASARSAAEFGSRFLAYVMRPDASFYGGLRELLEAIVEPERLASPISAARASSSSNPMGSLAATRSCGVTRPCTTSGSTRAATGRSAVFARAARR